MRGWKRYHSPVTIDEALVLLSSYDGQARVVAGGTDLLLDLMHGSHPPVEALVDVTRIPELQAVGEEDGWLVVGAAVTHNQIVHEPLFAAQATCLVESCGVVGGPQVRNVGTLGGNVAHALPAGDGTTSLVTLDAQAEIAQGGSRRWVPILEMYQGPGRSLIDPTRDLLLRLRFRPTGPGQGTAFKRIMRPQGVALPVLGCGVWVSLTPDGAIDAARVCVAPVAPTPVRLPTVEAALAGRAADGEDALAALLDDAARAMRDAIRPRTSAYRATADYRTEMAQVLLRRALPLAVQRARTGEAIPEGVGLQ